MYFKYHLVVVELKISYTNTCRVDFFHSRWDVVNYFYYKRTKEFIKLKKTYQNWAIQSFIYL